ncbi:MAG: CHAD domain-containing protein [Candidatus Thermoplasmatota archaeon]|nr:CHAD domain-containing protein [Candidatus Thermoplasmatota archaeon]
MKFSKDVRRFGAITIVERIEKLSKHMDRARSMEDPEDVHQLRVTSRRLRAALPVFKSCFQKRRFEGYIKGMKKVTRSLGMARDLDVQIIYLNSLLKEHRRKPMGPALRYLIDHRKNERTALQGEVIKALNDLSSSGLLDSIMKDCRGADDLNGDEPWPDSLFMLFRDNLTGPLDQLHQLSSSLQDEDKKEEHHEMRIAAKRLRYTLELFSRIFEDGLANEISYLKKLQDVLGEIHDCDVWSMQLPKLKDVVPESAELGKGLDLFMEHIKDRRSQLFVKAGEVWSLNAESLSFLRKMAGSDSYLPASRFPKVAFISDIHGNFHALGSVMDDALARGASLFINAGDSVGFGALPGKVIEEISADNFLNICGNFDLEMLDFGKKGKKGSAEREKSISLKHAKGSLTGSQKRTIAGFPSKRDLMIGPLKVHVVHSSPLSKKEHVTMDMPEPRLSELLTSCGADLLVIGHSHEQFLRDCSGGMVLNPGSVGRPGDGDPKAAYAIMDANTGEVQLIRVDYDIDAAVEAIRSEGLPERFSQMLIRGRALEVVMEEEKIMDSLGRSDEDLLSFREKVMATGSVFDPDPGHTQRVTSLSLSLFDQLQSIHMMGREERHLLDCSALLHDIGWSRGGGKHHVSSMLMVLNDNEMPFGIRERYIVASIARYHNSLPKSKHPNYSILNQIDRRTVSMLSSLLRIGDSLDASHEGKVKGIEVRLSEERIELLASASEPIPQEIEKFSVKKDLFEKVFKRSIVLSA